MEKCILPFTVDVEMKAYHNKAFPLGVMKANMPDYEIWLCNKLINCMHRLSGSFDVCNRDLWSEDDGLIITQVLHLYPKTFKKIDIISLNKDMLENGAYITGDYNEFFIEGKKAYKKYDYSHDYIIYGYDDEKEIFKSAAFMDNGGYNLFDIKYQNYYESIVENKVNQMYLEYRQFNYEYVPKINIVTIKEKLYCYLSSKKDYISFRADASCYGVAVWDELVEYISNIGEKNLDYRYSRVYMEHKGIMVKRFKKLYEYGYLQEDRFYKEYFNDICLPAQAIHHMFIKFNMTRDIKLLSKINKMMSDVNIKEINIIERVIDKLII